MAIIPDHTTPIRVVINEKHSPYPWQVIGNRIATPSRPIRKMLLVASEVNNQADAALIAAAPEMLAMLKGIITVHPITREPDFLNANFHEIELLIAKAEQSQNVP